MAVPRYASSRIEPRLAPWLALAAAVENDSVVQPIGTVLPELDHQRLEPIARPVGGARNRSDRKLCHVEGDRLLEGHTAFERGRLLARPGPDLGKPRAGGEIGIRLGISHALDRP